MTEEKNLCHLKVVNLKIIFSISVIIILSIKLNSLLYILKCIVTHQL